MAEKGKRPRRGRFVHVGVFGGIDYPRLLDDSPNGARNAFVWRRQFPTKGDKAIRAQAIRGRIALNGLYLPANAPWVPGFRRELLLFPAGSHDDQVDAIGLIGQMLDLITPGRVPEPPKRRVPDNWCTRCATDS